MTNNPPQPEDALYHQIDLQNLIAELSMRFINLPPDTIDEAIEDALETIGRFVDADRSYAFLMQDNGLYLDNTHEWCADGIEPQKDNLQNVPCETVPWWMDKLKRREDIHIVRMAELPDVARTEKEILEAQDIQSLVVVPMIQSESLVGFVGFDAVGQERQFSEETKTLLRMVGDLVANALQRKQTEAALRKSEARNRAILNAIPDDIFWISNEGIVVDVEVDDEDKLCTPLADLVGSSITQAVPPDQRTQLTTVINHVRETGCLDHLEYSIETLDGRERDLEMRIVPIETNGLLVIVRDLTERRRLQREIVHISEAERRRIGQDLHDKLASHLTGIAMLSRSLAYDTREGRLIESKELEEISHLAREGAEQARALARGLSPVKLNTHGLAAALHELATDTEVVARIDCTFDENGSLPELRGEVSTHLHRIAQEALNNTIKHAQADRVRIQLTATDDEVQLTIEDDGIGLSEADTPPSGIGFHTMHYRARLIGAHLSIDSPPEEGTRVTCTLPRYKAVPVDASIDG